MVERVIPFPVPVAGHAATGASPKRPILARPAPEAERPSDTVELSGAVRVIGRPLHPLAAGRVSAPVSFDGVLPARASGSIPIAPRAADRHAAATGVSAGRLIDIQA